MATAASDIFRQTTYKAEVTYGTIPVAASAQQLRRVADTVDLEKDTYESKEVRTDFQRQDYRHGVRRVTGGMEFELSAGTYKDFFAALLKRDFATVTAITGAGITIGGTGPTWTVTRAAGSWLSDNIKVGDVIRLSAGTFNALNPAKNLLVYDVTSATVLGVVVLNGSLLFAEGPIAGSTVTVIGKKTYIPLTGHTDRSFSIEHFYSDMSPVQSEVFSGCKIGKLEIGLPATGMATLKADIVGQNVTVAAAQYFTSPTAPTTSGVMAAVNGVVRAAGAASANITGLTISIEGGFTGQPVVGSNQIPAQAPGTVMVKGQFTAFFDSVTMRDAFLNETEIDVLGVFTADNSAASEFISLAIPRVKLGGAKKAPGDGGLILTCPFEALLNSAGGSGVKTEKSTITIQDSLA